MSSKKRRIKRKIKLASKAYAFAFFAADDQTSNWTNLAVDWKVRNLALKRKGIRMSFAIHEAGGIIFNRVYV
jgi:hypothetical protein